MSHYGLKMERYQTPGLLGEWAIWCSLGKDTACISSGAQNGRANSAAPTSVLVLAGNTAFFSNLGPMLKMSRSST